MMCWEPGGHFICGVRSAHAIKIAITIPTVPNRMALKRVSGSTAGTYTKNARTSFKAGRKFDQSQMAISAVICQLDFGSRGNRPITSMCA